MSGGYKHGGYRPDKYVVLKNKPEGLMFPDPDADYFVLRIDKDPHARKALMAYAESVKEDNQELSDDLICKLLYNYQNEFPNREADDVSAI